MSAVAATAPFLPLAPEFAEVLGDAPRLELVLACDAHEGPVYVPAEDALYFTSVPTPSRRVDIRRLALEGDRFPLPSSRLTTVRADAGMANGMCAERGGRLLVCEQGTVSGEAAVSRLDPLSGDREVVAAGWAGHPLNSPNDVVTGRDGAIWFTDPAYGHLQGFRPAPELPDGVYRCDGDGGRLVAVADALDKPNGLAMSPDERVLYVADSGAPRRVVAFDVVRGRLIGEREFARTDRGAPDGIAVDSDGRVYVACGEGVLVHLPDGELIGEICVPGAVNLAFGGRRGNLLFITTDDAVWAAALAATGDDPSTGA